MYVSFCFSTPCPDIHRLVFSTSAVTPSNTRTQRTAVYAVQSLRPLTNFSNVLAMPPPREPVSPFIPRTSTLAFHPKEMIYAVGNLDGIGRSCFFFSLVDTQNTNSALSSHHGLQDSSIDKLVRAIFNTFYLLSIPVILTIYPPISHVSARLRLVH